MNGPFATRAGRLAANQASQQTGDSGLALLQRDSVTEISSEPTTSPSKSLRFLTWLAGLAIGLSHVQFWVGGSNPNWGQPAVAGLALMIAYALERTGFAGTHGQEAPARNEPSAGRHTSTASSPLTAGRTDGLSHGRR